MLEIGLFGSGGELTGVPNYSRQNLYVNTLQYVTIVVFPSLGVQGMWYEIASAIIDDKSKQTLIPIALPAIGAIFRHPGGQDLRLRFSGNGQKVNATVRSLQEVEYFQKWIKSLEVDGTKNSDDSNES